MHNIISKLKNDKPWKNEIGKESARPPLRRPAPAPKFYPFFNFSDSPPPSFKKGEGGPNYAL